jgi:hypothetical protein
VLTDVVVVEASADDAEPAVDTTEIDASEEKDAEPAADVSVND